MELKKLLAIISRMCYNVEKMRGDDLMIEIRALHDEDFQKIKEIYKAAFSIPPWNDDWSNDTQLTEYLEEIMYAKYPLHLGLYQDGILCGISLGYIKHWCQGTEYYLDELCIHPDAQGKGLGTTFIRLIEQYAKNKGLCGIFLQTDNDMPAYRFYQKLGFEELPTHVSFFKSFEKEKTE